MSSCYQTMTSIEHPEAIKHFQSVCDACQELKSQSFNQSEIKLYADGYLHALRKSGQLERRDQDKLERLVQRWVHDPSSFIGPDGDIRQLYCR